MLKIFLNNQDRGRLNDSRRVCTSYGTSEFFEWKTAYRLKKIKIQIYKIVCFVINFYLIVNGISESN